MLNSRYIVLLFIWFLSAHSYALDNSKIPDWLKTPLGFKNGKVYAIGYGAITSDQNYYSARDEARRSAAAAILSDGRSQITSHCLETVVVADSQVLTEIPQTCFISARSGGVVAGFKRIVEEWHSPSTNEVFVLVEFNSNNIFLEP